MPPGSVAWQENWLHLLRLYGSEKNDGVLALQVPPKSHDFGVQDRGVTTALEDPAEPGSYPDWFEIYNPGAEAIDLGGLYLTDDLADPTQFQIPSGVIIPGSGFLLFYADGDTDQGDQHTNFKLSADGESVALFGADGATQIDAVTFGELATDIAYGRETDGSEIWGSMCAATPGSSNTGFCGTNNYIYLPLVIR